MMQQRLAQWLSARCAMSPSTQEQKDKMSAGIMSSLFGSVQRAGAGSLRAGVGRKDHARLSDQRCVLGSVFCCWVALCLALPTLSLADKVDDVVTTQMEDHAIPGLSLAIIQNGKIIKAQGYGFTDKSGKTPVTTSTDGFCRNRARRGNNDQRQR
jgi:CubicO group peptidase (beta-lactamase class C family)